MFLITSFCIYIAGCSILNKPPLLISHQVDYLMNARPLCQEVIDSSAEILMPAWNYDSKTHELFNLSFNSITPEEMVRAVYWKNIKPGKKKLIVVLPIIESVRFPGEHYTHVMTSWNGNDEFNVVLIEDSRKVFRLKELHDSKTEEEYISWLNVSAAAIKNYITDVRRLVDWAEKQSEIDSLKIGIIGSSVSSSLAALVMACDERIKAGVLDKGGGSFADLLIYSDEPGIKMVRKKVMERFSWTLREFDERIRSVLQPVEPINYASRIDPGKVLFFSARYDTWIPNFSVENFWKALGEPERIEFYVSHKIAFILSLTPVGVHYADYKIYNHFKKKLK